MEVHCYWPSSLLSVKTWVQKTPCFSFMSSRAQSRNWIICSSAFPPQQQCHSSEKGLSLHPKNLSRNFVTNLGSDILLFLHVAQSHFTPASKNILVNNIFQGEKLEINSKATVNNTHLPRLQYHQLIHRSQARQDNENRVNKGKRKQNGLL